MIGPRPKFMDSPFFVMDDENWHLKPGAPEDVVKEFNEYMGITDTPVEKSFTEKMNEALKPFQKNNK